MNSRYLILFMMLVFSGVFSYGQFTSPINPKQVVIDPDLIIQVGAFRQEPNSFVLKQKLSAIINNPVIVVTEDGFFKVRITGFSNQEEMEKLFPTLAFLGLKNIWVLPVKKQEESLPAVVVQQDTIIKPGSLNTDIPITEEDSSLVSQHIIVLQVDVFHNKTKALNAQKKITAKLKLPVEIVQEGEYYKVFITGFQSTEDVNKYYSPLAKLGYPQISLIENYRKK